MEIILGIYVAGLAILFAVFLVTAVASMLLDRELAFPIVAIVTVSWFCLGLVWCGVGLAVSLFVGA